mgnify:CR=1 FL=1
MRKLFSYVMVFVGGAGFAASVNLVSATEPTPKTAFMIISAEPKPDADYSAYRRAAGPLAREAGLKMIASSQQPLVLEGHWTYESVVIEAFPSKQALKEFWYSEGYQKAKKLREGLSKINFIIAVEGD